MIGSIFLASAMLAAHPAPSMPAPMLGGCTASKLWGTVLPEIPMEQDVHIVHVQAKQIFWNTRLMTVERLVNSIVPEMADGHDWLIIDASAAKCGSAQEVAAALEGPVGCTPERCFIVSKSVPMRKDPPETPAPAPAPAPAG
jgi:hypothetical protein